MPTTTPNLGLTLPTPNVDTGWGSTLNTDFTLIDDLFAANGAGPSVGLNVGSGKTLNVGGTLIGSGTVILGGGDNTGTVTAPTIRGAARTGTNVAGANLVIDAANGTGTGGSGKFIFRTAPVGSTGATANTFRSSFEVNSEGAIGVNSASYGSANQVLLSAGPSASVTWGAVDGSVISFSGQSQGDILYRGASAWERLPAGNSGQVLTTQGTGANPVWSSALTEGTAKTLAPNTSVLFSGLPNSIRRITIAISGLVSYDTEFFYVELGTSSGIVTTGYKSSTKVVNNDSGGGGNIRGSYSTSGFVFAVWDWYYEASGIITLQRVTGNEWTESHTLSCYNGGNYMTVSGGGNVTLPAALDRVQLRCPVSDFFNGGTANIQYE